MRRLGAAGRSRSHARRVGAKRRGFTLIELLVAVFISAVMFAIGYGALTEVARHRSAIAAAQQSFGDLQRAMRVMSDDLAQLHPRPIRDELGRVVAPAFVAEPGTPAPLAFSRGGRPPTSAHARGSLQRIEYLVEGGELVRFAWPVLDRTQSTAASRRVLMGEVRSLRFRLLGADGQWRDDWPTTEATLRDRPRAIEILLDTERYGTLRRLIEVPR